MECLLVTGKRELEEKEGDKNQEDVILLSVSNISPRNVFLLIISSISSLSFGEIHNVFKVINKQRHPLLVL